jgi:hypothetical protein
MSVLITLRGTNGSGKSTIVRQLMAIAPGPREERHEEGTGRPLGYVWPEAKLAVLGRYDVATGGCDGYSWKGATDWVLQQVSNYAWEGFNVVFEGVMVSMYGVNRFKQLNAAQTMLGNHLYLIQLTTPKEDCIAAVLARRARSIKQHAKEFNPHHLLDHHKSIGQGSYTLMKTVTVEWLDRERAFLRAKELLCI